MTLLKLRDFFIRIRSRSRDLVLPFLRRPTLYLGPKVPLVVRTRCSFSAQGPSVVRLIETTVCIFLIAKMVRTPQDFHKRAPRSFEIPDTFALLYVSLASRGP